MATEIFIAKTQYWRAAQDPITLNDWQAVCADDPSLRMQGEVSAVNPKTGEEVRIKSPGYAVFLHPASGERYVFEHRNGKVAARFDVQMVPKAKELAVKLAATVQDEDGEPL